MQNAFGSLSDDEVRQIALLVETLDRSTFDFLQLDVGDLKVTIGKGSVPPGAAVGGTPSAAVQAAPASPPAAAASPAAQAPTSTPAPSADNAADGAAAARHQPAVAVDGTEAIVAPMMGRFYAQPEPGAPTFVSVGSEVTPDTTVGLIEVMKVFSAVRAGIAGTITEICVQDAHFVEFGEVLFRVQPAEQRSESAAA